MANKDKASLFVDTFNLYKVVYTAQFHIPKRDRIALGNRILDHTEKVLSSFAMAYNIEDNKLQNIDKFIIEFEALKMCIRLGFELDIYNVESDINAMREYLARIDESVEKWRAYVVSNRQER